MIAFLNLLKALPEIIQLLNTLQKAIDEAEADRKVKDDLKAIHEAFTTKDAAKLNAIFSSK